MIEILNQLGLNELDLLNIVAIVVALLLALALLRAFLRLTKSIVRMGCAIIILVGLTLLLLSIYSGA